MQGCTVITEHWIILIIEMELLCLCKHGPGNFVQDTKAWHVNLVYKFEFLGIQTRKYMIDSMVFNLGTRHIVHKIKK